MSTRGPWQTIPDDILFSIMDIVDRLDFLEADNILPRIWELRVDTGATHRMSRRVKPGILAVRQICSHWRTAALTRAKQWPSGITFLRWDQTFYGEDNAIDKSEIEAEEISNKVARALDGSELEILANFMTLRGLDAFTSIILGQFANVIRRLWVHPHFEHPKPWNLPNLPRMRGLSIWGTQKLMPNFGTLPELLSLEQWQCAEDRLVCLSA
jgi:hypothetical protein